jgi:hypothetical protein
VTVVLDFGRTISLGPVCTSKYQARRILAGRQGIQVDVRLRTSVPGSPSGIFDWQITPVPALFEYLRNDLKGMFELDDLMLEGQQVLNARFGTLHPHEFPKLSDKRDIAACYPVARSRHNYLCSKVRAGLTDDVPTLFLYSKALSEAEYSQLSELVRAYNPRKRIHLLAVGDESVGWMGQDALWDRALGPYRIDATEEQKIDAPAVKITDFLAFQMKRFGRHLKSRQF